MRQPDLGQDPDRIVLADWEQERLAELAATAGDERLAWPYQRRGRRFRHKNEPPSV